jgi:hypothetical protein
MLNKQMKKWAWMIVVLMFLTFVPVSGVQAEIYGGTTWDDLAWSLDSESGTLTIRGEGQMNPDYDGVQDYPWDGYSYDINEVNIETGVLSIGAWAFGFCVNLTKVTIPDSVLDISEYAFFDFDTSLMIYCNEGSYAQEYAIEHEIPYVLLNGRAPIPGDADGDGAVTIADIQTVYNYLLTGNLSGDQLLVADFDQDGTVTIADVQAIYNYVFPNFDLALTSASSVDLPLEFSAAQGATNVVLSAITLTNNSSDTSENLLITKLFLQGIFGVADSLGASSENQPKAQDFINIRIVTANANDLSVIYSSAALEETGTLLTLAQPIELGSTDDTKRVTIWVLADVAQSAPLGGTFGVSLGDGGAGVDVELKGKITGRTKSLTDVSIGGSTLLVTPATVEVTAQTVTDISTLDGAPQAGDIIAVFNFMNDGNKAVVVNQLSLQDVLDHLTGVEVNVSKSDNSALLGSGKIGDGAIALSHEGALANILRLEPGGSGTVIVSIGASLPAADYANTETRIGLVRGSLAAPGSGTTFIEPGNTTVKYFVNNDAVSAAVHFLTSAVSGATVSAVNLAANTMTAFNQGLLDVGSITVTAGNGGANITGIQLSRTGLSTDQVIKGISIWRESKKLNASAVFSAGSADITFTQPLDLAAAQSAILRVCVNINEASSEVQAGAQFRITVDEVKGATGNLLPATSGIFTLANVTLGTLRVDLAADRPTGDLDVGAIGAPLAKFVFSANHEDQYLSQITLTQLGSVADADLTNLELYDELGALIASSPQRNGRTLTFTLADDLLILDDGTSISLELRGDVAGGSGRTIHFVVADPEDVLSIGRTYGTHAAPVLTAPATNGQIIRIK